MKGKCRNSLFFLTSAILDAEINLGKQLVAMKQQQDKSSEEIQRLKEILLAKETEVRASNFMHCYAYSELDYGSLVFVSHNQGR